MMDRAPEALRDATASNLAEAALSYARRGWRVLPCLPRSKRPATAHGLHDATLDEAAIDRWWRERPDLNIGVATGASSGFWALDVDHDEEKREFGNDTLDRIEQQHGLLPATVIQRTPSGGAHWLFRWDREIRNSARKLGPGLDVRGDGGYLVLAPSVHPSGGIYQWDPDAHPDAVDLASAPEWFTELLTTKLRDLGARELRCGSATRDDYVQSAVERELGRVLAASEGRRNDQLNESAFALGTLVGAGAIDRSIVEDRLLIAGKAVGLEDREVLLTVASGLNAGELKPRDLNRSNGDWTPGADLDARLGRTPVPPRITATPYQWIEPMNIPTRDWLHRRHLIRGYVSATVAPGGVGKSKLKVTECLEQVSGKDLLGHGHRLPPMRVWYFNLEDPLDELQRCIQAAALHYQLAPEDLANRLFVDSGRDQELVIATSTRDGFCIVAPIVEPLIEEIRRRAIDTVIIDPFVSCHRCPENDNGAIDAVAKQWGKIAGSAGCAVELIHHSRKLGADNEVTTESARGAKALTDACRSVRVINRMTKQEADRAGVENPGLFFRAYIDKGNLAPPARHSEWYRLQSIELGNGIMGLGGDSVGVVTAWKWPDPLDGMGVGDLVAVQRRVAESDWRENSQAEKWVGIAVAEVLGLNVSHRDEKSRILEMLKIWISTGALKIEEALDEKRRPKKFVRVGTWANT